jgi:glutamine synthetase adenylyltransferase
LIKARPVAGDLELGTTFLKEIEPFIYRRYLDYSTVDELRHMKLRIENELLSGAAKERNVKLGYGGIREIEFFTQALQLVNGGYQPKLRCPSTLPALAALAGYKFITPEDRDKLTEAYRFLRQAEHKVQIVQEAHAHSIPDGKEEEQAFARRLGYRRKGKLSERELFWRDHERTTNTVRGIFDRLFYGERYDMRHSLLDFGRTLSATTALDPLLDSLVSRLQQVMNVGRIAIFIEDKNSQAGYRVARAAGLSSEMIVPPDFREMIRVRSGESWRGFDDIQPAHLFLAFGDSSTRRKITRVTSETPSAQSARPQERQKATAGTSVCVEQFISISPCNPLSRVHR